MKTRFLILALLLFIYIPNPSASGQVASIASWNIEGFEPIATAKAERVAKAIHNLSPDLIVLVEVNPDNVVNEIITSLTGLGDNYRATILPQTAIQNIAILAKSNVSVSGARLIPGSNANQGALRKALSANVRIGNFDFILIGVHMKASRGAGPRSTRTREARAIANFIRTATQGNEKDVLVIGDYNMIPGEDAVNFSTMSPGPGNNEFLRFVSSESLLGQRSHISSCNPLRGSLLDGFAVSRLQTREYVASSLRIVPFTDSTVFRSDSGAALNCTSYTGFISDHLPLIAQFRTADDDD